MRCGRRWQHSFATVRRGDDRLDALSQSSRPGGGTTQPVVPTRTSGERRIRHPGGVSHFDELARSTFVLLTTYRRNGEAVPTPVWIAPDGERLLVTTGAESGKVKRLGHTSRVTLTPCDMRGKVKKGAVSVEAVAVVDDSAETREALDAAMLKKYGIQYKIARSRERKDRPAQSVALVITPA